MGRAARVDVKEPSELRSVSEWAVRLTTRLAGETSGTTAVGADSEAEGCISAGAGSEEMFARER